MNGVTKTGLPSWQPYTEFNTSILTDAPGVRTKSGNKKPGRETVDILCAFDIETSRIPGTEQAAIYHWQMQIGFDAPTVYGRDADSVREFFETLAVAVGKRRLIVWVHNLSYEFHFLRGLFDEIPATDVFAVSSRKPVKLKLFGGALEFRCSYILTNMSLKQWTTKMQVEHQKLDAGDYDHTAVRFPWTELTAEEREYCRNDVLGLIEALQKQLELNNDTLDTIPLTSTGYVRRDVKHVMRNYGFNALQAVQPSPEVFIALMEAFRGGNTHANRYFSGCLIENVASFDRSSSYPEVCINAKFPMGAMRRSRTSDPEKEITTGKCVLMRVLFHNIRLKDRYCPCPYLPVAKCRKVPKFGTILDNGRILSAAQAETTLTELDFIIISNQYEWDRLEVIDMWSAWAGALPDMLRNLIISYYRNKTALKGVKGLEAYYDKEKARLNSIYGLEAQNPCRQSIVYNHSLPGDNLFSEEEGDVAELLRQSRKQPYGSYMWGVWVTANARMELQKGIDLTGDMFVYADTDSVKFCGEVSFDQYNDEKITLSQATGAYADDPSGERHFMGVYENEGVYDQFITYGAKKYAFVKGGRLGITIAGVNKRAGAKELQKRGGIEALKPGFIFSEGGGTESVFNDTDGGCIEIDGHSIHLYPNIYIRPSTYRLGITDDYSDILHDADLFRKLAHEKFIKQHLIK